MKVTTIPGWDLPVELVSAWQDLLRADPHIGSPFFRPEFVEAAARVRDDVEVAVLEEGSKVVGFFPFERGAGNVGRPVGGRLSDFHGLVLQGHYRIDPVELIRGCRLSAWYFNHLIVAQSALAPFVWTINSSPYIDLSAGYDAYLGERRAAGAGDVMQTLNKRKKSERQFGSIRFELQSVDRAALHTLVSWKSQQYRESKVVSVFSYDWVTELLERLLAMPASADFAGMLSALYLGERLAAVHFGMRSRTAIHWWFPAYDPQLGKYSPGSQLLLELARAAELLSIGRIDLGEGDEVYKKSFMNGATRIGKGSIDLRPARRTLWRWWHHTHQWVRESPLRRPATVPWRFIRNMRDNAQLR
jgi:CelD/BcsL family acetyltransferase involved in cellulose biosynthesis